MKAPPPSPTFRRLLLSLPLLGPFLRQLRLALPPPFYFTPPTLRLLAEDPLMRRFPRPWRLLPLLLCLLPAGRATLARWTIGLLRCLFPRRYHTQDIPPAALCLDLDNPRWVLALAECAQGAERDFVLEWLRPGDSFLDIGANQGAYTALAAARVGPDGFVLAVEPQPRLAEALRRTLRASPVARWQVHAAVLADSPGTASLIVPWQHSGQAGLYPGFSAAWDFHELTVPRRTLDDLLDGLDLPGRLLVKVDIEGAEPAFLRGASRFLSSRRPDLLIEINPRALAAAGSSPGALAAALRELGYRSWARLSQPELPRPLPGIPCQEINLLVTAT